MTVTYCGTCGTANGAAAKFCRHCGAELSAQEAISTLAPSSNPSAAKPNHLRLVPPEAEIIPLAPAVTAETSDQPTAPQTATTQTEERAVETLRTLREAQAIEAQQEEEARQIKQAAAQSLSRRLAQKSGRTGSGAAAKTAPETSAEIAKATDAHDTKKSNIPLVTPKELKNPPVPIRAQVRESEPEERPIIERYGEHHGAPPSEAVAERHALPLNSASAMQQVEAQNRAGFWVRLTASALGVSLLFGGIYAYRHPSFSDGLANVARNLLSPEEQSTQLLLASRADLEAGNVTDATQKLERAVALTPEATKPREELAEAYVKTGRTEEALRELDSVIKIAPENLDARLKIASLQQFKGNLAEARAQYQKIINLGPDTAQATQALEAVEQIDQTLNANALASNHNDNLRMRRNIPIKRAETVLPTTVLTRPTVGSTGRPSPYTTGVNRSFDWSPVRTVEAPDPTTVAAMHKNLGIRYYNIREYGAALAELQHAAKLTPNDKDLYYFLGGTYSGLGQPLKAFDSYKRCDSGTYANVSQNGAKKIEKAARKEYQQQQDQKFKNVPQTEAANNTNRNNALQNLSAPIIAPLGSRAFSNTPDK